MITFSMRPRNSMLRSEPDQYYNANSRGFLVNFCDNVLEQTFAGLLIFGLRFVTWIEAMTKFEAAILGFVLYRDVRMKKLLLATVCVIALTLGAQAKPVQLPFLDNRWVIAYDSELFAGACIATTTPYDLLKLKISFITAYPKGRDRKTLVRWSF